MIQEGVNYEEYCYNLTHNLNCIGGCNSDAGCNPLGIPFAAIRLQHVADKLEMLVGPDVKNIYVASDDSDWVEHQIELMKIELPSVRFFTLQKPKPESPKNVKVTDPYLGSNEPYPGYFYMRSHGGTDSGVHLFASMEICRQCEGFVGHMGCGGTQLHYQYMCVQHAGTKGLCPAMYDLRQGLWLNGKDKII
jgi:hypothetical protein